MSLIVQPSIDRFELPHFSGEGSFQIAVARSGPRAPDARNTPVVFVTDADFLFGVATELARYGVMGQILPPALIVGIGYGADLAAFAKLRTPDLTPPLSESGRQSISAMTGFMGDKAGRADDFLSFLTGALRNEILSRYPDGEGGKRAVVGHSLGGLFVAHALIERPDAFDVYIASSPSLWWDDFAIVQRAASLSARLSAISSKPAVFIAAGGKEQDIPKSVPESLGVKLEDAQAIVKRARMVDAAREFAVQMRGAGLASVMHVTLEGEDHTSAAPVAFLRGFNATLGLNPLG